MGLRFHENTAALWPLLFSSNPKITPEPTPVPRITRDNFQLNTRIDVRTVSVSKSVIVNSLLGIAESQLHGIVVEGCLLCWNVYIFTSGQICMTLIRAGSSSNIELHLGVSVLPLDIWSWNIAIVWIPVGGTRRQYLIVVTSCNLRHTCVTISWHDRSWQSQHLRSKQCSHKITLKYGFKFKFNRICNGMVFTCGHSLLSVHR